MCWTMISCCRFKLETGFWGWFGGDWTQLSGFATGRCCCSPCFWLIRPSFSTSSGVCPPFVFLARLKQGDAARGKMLGRPRNLNGVGKTGVEGRDVIGVVTSTRWGWGFGKTTSSIKSLGWKSSSEIRSPFLQHSVTQSGVTILILFCLWSDASYFLLSDASRPATRRWVESDFNSKSNRPPRDTINAQRRFTSSFESPEVEMLSPEKICFGEMRPNPENGSRVPHWTDRVTQSSLRTGTSSKPETSRNSISSKSGPPKQWVTAEDR